MNIDDFMPSGETRPATCETHGTFESRHICRDMWSRCPTCAAERNAREAYARQMAERQAETERWQKRLGHAGIPERFRTRTLGTFVATTPQQTHALAVATQYASDTINNPRTGRSLVMIGRPGTGKTHLAVGVGLKAMEAGHSVLFISVSRAIRRIKATWDKPATETETQVIGTLVGVDILILDEVGIQFGSDTEKNHLFDILNGRYEERRPTIILSNLDITGVANYLGERVMDRLREDGGEVLVFNWQSYRTQAGVA